MTQEEIDNRALELYPIKPYPVQSKDFNIVETIDLNQIAREAYLRGYEDSPKENKKSVEIDDFDYCQITEPSDEEVCFKLTPIESSRYKRFRLNHSHKDTEIGAIGGGLSISIMPTSIGDIVSCRCEICKKVADITDIDSW